MCSGILFVGLAVAILSGDLSRGAIEDVGLRQLLSQQLLLLLHMSTVIISIITFTIITRDMACHRRPSQRGLWRQLVGAVKL